MTYEYYRLKVIETGLTEENYFIINNSEMAKPSLFQSDF